ncbi:hypothetical protein PSACC_01646 [Paramicrosporidium saccamoebae]|uniref:Uncharacterized protein n=1 Tax=Paramicrosporidium saccamoebae TaxID=1246581 RepID=A0A2H9TLA8_9FUNG|nr:hypothetical protein PSACC_01646 [Paramicrosporidium saccamoebae]
MSHKYLSFTAVRYESGDVFGFLLAWCSLIPHVVIVAQVTAFLLAESHRRRLQAGTLLAGQVLNETVNSALKKIIRQPRPLGTNRDDFGMPSSHAQFMGFLLVAAMIMLPRVHPSVGQRLTIWIVRLGVMASTLFAAFSRYPSRHHSES